MFRWRIYLFTVGAFALPLGGLWLHAWHVGVGLKWLKPEPDILAIAVLSVGASALFAAYAAKAVAKP